MEREVEIYVAGDGHSPFAQWLNAISDITATAHVLVALDVLREGNFSHCRSIGCGVFEHAMRESVGHYIYFALVGDDELIVLGGGTVTSQKEDCARAFDLWKEFKAHAH